MPNYKQVLKYFVSAHVACPVFLIFSLSCYFPSPSQFLTFLTCVTVAVIDWQVCSWCPVQDSSRQFISACGFLNAHMEPFVNGNIWIHFVQCTFIEQILPHLITDTPSPCHTTCSHRNVHDRGNCSVNLFSSCLSACNLPM